MRFIIIAMLFVMIVGCAKKGTDVAVVGAKDGFSVVKLFTTEKCSVYRFYDGGRHHYFTSCGEAIGTYSESCGKGCTISLDENIGGP